MKKFVPESLNEIYGPGYTSTTTMGSFDNNEKTRLGSFGAYTYKFVDWDGPTLVKVEVVKNELSSEPFYLLSRVNYNHSIGDFIELSGDENEIEVEEDEYNDMVIPITTEFIENIILGSSRTGEAIIPDLLYINNNKEFEKVAVIEQPSKDSDIVRVVDKRNEEDFEE